MNLMKDTEEGKKRVQEAKERLDFYTAQRYKPEQADGDSAPMGFEPMHEGVEDFGVQGGYGLPADEPAHGETPSDDGEVSAGRTPRGEMQQEDQDHDSDMGLEPEIPMEEDMSPLEPLPNV